MEALNVYICIDTAHMPKKYIYAYSNSFYTSFFFFAKFKQLITRQKKTPNKYVQISDLKIEEKIFCFSKLIQKIYMNKFRKKKKSSDLKSNNPSVYR